MKRAIWTKIATCWLAEETEKKKTGGRIKKSQNRYISTPCATALACDGANLTARIYFPIFQFPVIILHTPLQTVLQGSGFIFISLTAASSETYD